ncbi:MAG: von Willebrand factor type A domain-containing protein [Ferruginibacter sp.]
MKRLLIIITSFLFVFTAIGQNKSIIITGSVRDKKGNPLKGISISEKLRNNTTVSSLAGTYTLTVEGANSVLVFSAKDLKTKEVTVKDKIMFDVVLDSSIVLSGKVSDKNGSPLSGITIAVKGKKTGVASAADGSYSLTVDESNVQLVFTGVGFIKQEIKTGKQKTINVILEPAAQMLNEVVVVGYATIQRKSLSYAMQSVASEELSGKVAGVQVTGVPGNTTGVSVRGMNSNQLGYNGNYSGEDFNTESYDRITENNFHKVKDNPLSTFSIDVDAASYSNVRRFLNAGQLPPAGAVRIEEMVNYFKYTYAQPVNADPFSVNTEIADAPWNKKHKLVLIGLQGKKIETGKLPPSNLVFLIDVSGSMQGPDRIGLVKASLKLLIDQLRAEDKVAMVVYAGAAGLVLPSTSGADKTKLKDAVDRLEAGGSTAGGAGLKLAYKTAKDNFLKNGNNRVILCTDGDFNVGESSDDAMERLIEDERKSGVFLTVLGYGAGNYKDSKMQKLADKGNGNHAYIDGLSEAKKVLVNEFGGTLFTIAKDVKLQVEFNPARVQAYRLIGYENRMLAKEDFNNDKKDAGEMGSGHTVTALYEIIPVGVKSKFLNKVDALKYQDNNIAFSRSAQTDELMTVKFRYKKPDGDTSKLFEYPVKDNKLTLAGTSDNFRFAAAVAEFGLLLRNSDYKAGSSFENVLALAGRSKGSDEEGYRSEFIQLVKSARLLADKKEETPGENSDE